MTVNEIAALLVKANDRKTLKTALDAALQHWDAICPELLRALSFPPSMVEQKQSDLMFFAMYLLAEKRETAAFPLLIQYFSTPGEDAANSTGDVVTVALHRILASTFGGDLNSLKSLIENKNIYEFSRIAGLSAMVTLLYEGVLQRCDVVDYFKSLMQQATDDDYTFNAFLVSRCCDIHPAELREDIRHLYEADAVEGFVIGWEDVEEACDRMPLESFCSYKEERYSYIHSAFDELVRYPYFQTPDEQRPIKGNPKPVRAVALNHQTKRVEKIGRNDLCLCGSGKKYKKCCLNSRR